MKQKFNLDVERSQEFLRRFYSAMRSPDHGFLNANGSSRFVGSQYVSDLSTDFTYGDNKLHVDWRIVQTESGNLLSLESIEDSDSADDSVILEFVNSVLSETLAKHSKKYFRRTYYSVISGCNLPGEYWFPGFRFAPLYPDDSARLIHAERIVVIDQNVDAIDARHADEVAREKAMLFSSFLSFILNVPLVEPRHEERYFLTDADSAQRQMVRHSTQLIDHGRVLSMPKKGEICRLGEYKDTVFNPLRPTNQYLVCPTESRRIISSVMRGDKATRDSFLYCCVLYRLGQIIGKVSPTARLSYEVSAVEAIIKRKGSQAESFTDFMNSYAGEDRDFYRLMYEKVRSAHWHAGALVLGELDFSDPFIASPGRHMTHNVVMASHDLVRKGILNWLNEHVELSGRAT